ncbi:MAG: hypothetical protein OEV42_17765 [Deltaproteobacteria bacterium]|nr:hypothetical protein [Deltaproteobacteria bacterium]
MQNISKYKKNGILAVVTSLLLVVASCKTGTYFYGKKLPGYIEVVSDLSIKKIDLSSGKREDVTKRGPFEVMNFDLSQNGMDRIIALTKMGKGKTELVLFTDGKETRTLASKNHVTHPSFSPQGDTISYIFQKYKKRKTKYWLNDCYLYLVNIDGSMDRKASQSSIRCFPKASWFPDGRRLAVGTKGLSIIVIDLDKGTEGKVIDFGTAPTVSNDGKKIAYLSKNVDAATKKMMSDFQNITVEAYYNKSYLKGYEGKEGAKKFSTLFLKNSIYVYDISTGENKRLTGDMIIETPILWSPDDNYLVYDERLGEAGDIYAVEIETGKRFKVTSEHGRVMVWRK